MKKKKILLLSDDLRMNSGIATMSRELVLGTVHHYDWVQIAGAIKHPESGKIVDLNQATNQMLNRTDSYVKLYPVEFLRVLAPVQIISPLGNTTSRFKT